MTSSCHRIKVYSVNKTKTATAARLNFLKQNNLAFLPITQPGEFDLEDDETYDKEMAARGGRDPDDEAWKS